MAAFGCNNICSELPSRRMDENWTVESLTRLRERVESYGISLDMVPVTMTSASITGAADARDLSGPEP